jgi:hypothetical protein
VHAAERLEDTLGGVLLDGSPDLPYGGPEMGREDTAGVLKKLTRYGCGRLLPRAILHGKDIGAVAGENAPRLLGL